MGIFDQNKQWNFTVGASEQDCVQAFRNAFDQGGGLLRAADWGFGQDSDPNSGHHHVAVFEGRSGLGGFLNSLSKNGSERSQAAIGTTVAFSAEEDDGSTECAMWLKEASTNMGFKNEASLLRCYMRQVEQRLRQLDPQLQLQKAR